MDSETFTRATSAYTLHMPDGAERVAEKLPVAVSDLGASHVGFRCGSDLEAIGVVTLALAAVGDDRPMTLTTGMGVHRRIVWAGRIE